MVLVPYQGFHDPSFLVLTSLGWRIPQAADSSVSLINRCQLLAGRCESGPGAIQVFRFQIFESLFGVSNCDDTQFLLWEIVYSEILKPFCIGFMNLLPYIFPVLHSFCYCYHVTALNLREQLERFLQEQDIYLFSLCFSDISPSGQYYEPLFSILEIILWSVAFSISQYPYTFGYLFFFYSLFFP